MKRLVFLKLRVKQRMDIQNPTPPKSKDSQQLKFGYEEFYRKWRNIKLHGYDRKTSDLSVS